MNCEELYEMMKNRMVGRNKTFESFKGKSLDEQREILDDLSVSEFLYWYDSMVKRDHYEPCESYYCDTHNIVR